MAEETQIRETLSDICADFFAFVFTISKSQDPGESDPIYRKVDELFRNMDLKARQNDIPLEDLQLAKYGLCAFLDELILASNWPLRATWSGKPLQLLYFNDFSAGEEFYVKLDQLKLTRDARKLDLLEVYYQIMSLGFKGKYSDLQGMERHKVLVDTISRELRAAKGAEGNELSPKWKPTDNLPKLSRSAPVWVVPVILGFILVALFSAYTWVLDGMVDGLREAVGLSGGGDSAK